MRRRSLEELRGRRDRSLISRFLDAMKDGSWRVRKSGVDILHDEYPPEAYMSGLIDLLGLEDNAGARNSAIELLVRLGKKATPYLMEAFKTPNRDVRKFIIDILGELMDSRALPLMLEAIKDEDDNVRVTAVEHLGKAGEPSVVDALIGILGSGDLWTAYPAADALGRIGNKRAVPYLLEALKKKPLREPVLNALGRLADPDSLGGVISLLEEPSRSIREQTILTVERMYRNGVSAERVSSELKRILGGRAVDILVEYAWSAKREVRISAILLIGLLRDAAAYGPLLDVSQEEEFSGEVKRALVFIGREKPDSLLSLFDTDNPHQLRFIADVAAEIGSPVYTLILRRLMANDDGHVRAIAARGLARLNDTEAVGGLMGLLADPYEDVQEAGVSALASMRSDLDVESIIEMLKSPNAGLRRNAARLLGKIREERAVNHLGFALKDEHVRVRKAVVEAFASIGTERAVRYLSHALTDEDPDIRISATLSLGAIGGEGIVDALSLLTADPDGFVRGSAAKALGMLRSEGAVKPLVPLLEDPSGFVVTAAIEGLRALGGTEARRAIEGMLDARDEEVRRTAILSLASFPGTEDRLLPYLRDPDWATRIAAVRALGRSDDERVRSEFERLLDVEEDSTVAKTVREFLRV